MPRRRRRRFAIWVLSSPWRAFAALVLIALLVDCCLLFAQFGGTAWIVSPPVASPTPNPFEPAPAAPTAPQPTPIL